jgi:hypothetical protein
LSIGQRIDINRHFSNTVGNNAAPADLNSLPKNPDAPLRGIDR